MARWVFLADPGSYGWDQLVRDGRTVWDGIRNRTAQTRLRDCRAGDRVLLYHTAPDKALVGIARVVRAPYPDPSDDQRVAVDLEPLTALERPLRLDEIKEDETLAAMGFVRMPRVAVHGIEDAQWERVLALSGTDPATAAGHDPTEAGGP